MTISGLYALLGLAMCLFGLTVIGTKPLLSPKNILVGYAAATVLFGYLLYPISIPIVPPDASDAVIAQQMTRSFGLNIASYVLICIGVLTGTRRRAAKADSSLLRAVKGIPARRAFLWALFYLSVGTLGLLYTFSAMGVVPLFADDPLAAKYFTFNIVKFIDYRPIYTLALNFLTVALTLFLALVAGFFSPAKITRWMSVLLVAATAFSILLTVKRGPLLLPFIWVFTALVFCRRIRPRTFVTGALLVMLAAVVMWAIREGQVELDQLLRGFANSFFIEPRDFGRVLVHLSEHPNLDVWAWGKTYLAAAVSLIPSSVSRFKSAYSIGRLTLVSLGLSPEASGGPRIGFIGEAYLNWRLAGIILVSFVYGIIVARLNDHFRSVYEDVARLDVRVLWVSFLMFNALSFFQSASGVAQFLIVRTALLLPLVVSFRSSYRQRARSDATPVSRPGHLS